MAVERPIIVKPLELDNLVASTTTAGFPVSNLADFYAVGLHWRSTAAVCWVRGEFDGSRAVDFLSVIAANALPGTKIRLRLGITQAQVDGTAPYDSGAVDFISPAVTRESGLYHSHLEIPSVQNATWFRIDITGHTNEFQAANIVLGKAIRPSHYYNWSYEFGVEDLGQGGFTPWGVFDETPGLIFRTLAFTLAWQTQAEFENSFRPLLEQLGKRGIVFCCFDPDPNVTRQAKTYLGIFEKPPFARGTRKPGYTQDFSLISMI